MDELLKNISNLEELTYDEEEIYQLLDNLLKSSSRGSLGDYQPLGEKNNSNSINIDEDFKIYLKNYLINLYVE